MFEAAYEERSLSRAAVRLATGSPLVFANALNLIGGTLIVGVVTTLLGRGPRFEARPIEE